MFIIPLTKLNYQQLLEKLKKLVNEKLPNIIILASQPLIEDLYHANTKLAILLVDVDNKYITDNDKIHYQYVRIMLMEMYIGWLKISEFDNINLQLKLNRRTTAPDTTLYTHTSWINGDDFANINSDVIKNMIVIYDKNNGWSI